jgi:hypothetical protein
MFMPTEIRMSTNITMWMMEKAPYRSLRRKSEVPNRSIIPNVHAPKKSAVLSLFLCSIASETAVFAFCCCRSSNSYNCCSLKMENGDGLYFNAE